MCPKWAFTAIIWFSWSQLCCVFLRKIFFPEEHRLLFLLLLDGLNNSFGKMETAAWGLLEGSQEPSVLLRLDITAHSHSSLGAECRKGLHLSRTLVDLSHLQEAFFEGPYSLAHLHVSSAWDIPRVVTGLHLGALLKTTGCHKHRFRRGSLCMHCCHRRASRESTVWS